MKFEEYVRHDALGLAGLVAKGDVTASELLEVAIARTETVNARINAIVRPLYARARTRIGETPMDRPFSGVPFLLKDLSAELGGEVITGGSRFFGDYVATHDSPLVRRYRDAGLVIFGKTNTPEFGLTPFTEPALYGAARNPWNLDHTPGGSSGGSGAAIAAGIVPMANGGDGGGSIRIPASCNGLVGLKPTRGRTPDLTGESWWGCATEHVLTRSVRDCAAALDATGGPFPGNPYFTAAPEMAFLERIRTPPKPLKIAFTAQPLVGRAMDPECRKGLELTVKLLEELGHQVVDATPPVSRETFLLAFITMITSETAGIVALRARELGREPRRDELEPATRAFRRIGEAMNGADVAIARRQFLAISRAVGEWFEDYDILVTPTLGRPPFKIGALQPSLVEQLQVEALNRLPVAGLVKGGRMLLPIADKTFDWIPNTPLFNVTGQPSISLPLHWSPEGLPVGMMFTARFGDDARLLQLSAQLEQARPWFDRRAPL
jgi:amidase